MVFILLSIKNNALRCDLCIISLINIKKKYKKVNEKTRRARFSHVVESVAHLRCSLCRISVRRLSPKTRPTLPALADLREFASRQVDWRRNGMDVFVLKGERSDDVEICIAFDLSIALR